MGKFYTAPGPFSISSSAFAENGAIPAKYMCDGAGISAPLSWQKVPANAAELVLFVIDDSATGVNGRVRWIVGGIEFVLYALKRQIKLSPGFKPATAEQEYGAGKDILDQAAVIEAVYHRP